MKRLISLIAILLTVAPLASAQTGKAEQQVLQAEKDRFAAMIKGDRPALEKLLADDLTYTHSSSVLDTKAAYMAGLRSGKSKYEAIDRKPSTVRLYGDTAIITGDAQIKLRSQPAPFWIRYTLMYVKQGAAWKMVAWQSTRIPEAK